MHVDLTLVVRGAAGEHPTVDHGRLERRRVPELDRIDRLDVVVAVDEGGRGVRGVEPVAVDDRVAAGRGDLDVLEADPAQVVSDPLGGAAAVLAVLGQAGDAGDPQERRYESRRSSAWSSSQASTTGSMAAGLVVVMTAMVCEPDVPRRRGRT
jgi:hypothetical protein